MDFDSALVLVAPGVATVCTALSRPALYGSLLCLCLHPQPQGAVYRGQEHIRTCGTRLLGNAHEEREGLNNLAEGLTSTPFRTEVSVP